MKVSTAYHGWWVVLCTFVVALYGWGLGFYGLSLYLVALHKAHGWSPATISSAITFYYVVGAFLVMQVGDVIQKRGARLVVTGGTALMGLGVLGLTVIDQPWQLYVAFLIMIPGWAAMGGGSINTIIAQWFNRRRDSPTRWSAGFARSAGRAKSASIVSSTSLLSSPCCWLPAASSL